VASKGSCKATEAGVAIDIRTTPESPVLKWAFGLLTAYSGPFGAFLYVLGCREPLPVHEQLSLLQIRSGRTDGGVHKHRLSFDTTVALKKTA
jgi:hypothetical protein